MKIGRRILLGACAVGLGGGLMPLRAIAQTVGPNKVATETDKIIKTKVDRLVQPLIDSDTVAGLTIGLVDGDHTTVLGYGRISSSQPETPTGDTLYEIGSITKVFTGTLLADMAARGAVHLNDALATCLPAGTKLPTYQGTPITLLDLATQSSGLPRLPSNLALSRETMANPYANYSPTMLLTFLSGYHLTRKPGTKYEYSNLGVGLLGYALAQKAHAPYEELIKTRICTPLGMSDTVITLTPALRARLAEGHDADLNPVSPWDLNVLSPAGGIKSSVNDMLRFMKANMGLTPTALRAVFDAAQKPQRPIEGPGQIGLNWHIQPGGKVVWHNGQTGGYHGLIAFDRDTKQGVVLLSNTGSAALDQLGFALLSLLAGGDPQPMKIRMPAKIDTAVYARYVGDYQLAPGAILTVTRDGDRLKAKLTGQDAYRIYPASETEFFYRVADAQISFVKNDQGQVEKLVLHQNGQDIPAKKIK